MSYFGHPQEWAGKRLSTPSFGFENDRDGSAETAGVPGDLSVF